jgi:hypothetical protein
MKRQIPRKQTFVIAFFVVGKGTRRRKGEESIRNKILKFEYSNFIYETENIEFLRENGIELEGSGDCREKPELRGGHERYAGVIVQEDRRN